MKNDNIVPIKLTNERAWRTYLGGSLLDELHGLKVREDGHFPEEWIASLISARNAGREWKKDEGLSKLAKAPHPYLKDVIETDPEGYLGQGHAASLGASLGVLVKLIDSGERLAIQVHPDREQAKKLFHSDYGKTECWHILGGREIDGEAPYIYLGFKEGVNRERWQRLFQKQDIQGMLECLHRFSIKSGDTVLIEGGVPHAIGAGCFLIEIQEPTDYTIRVERTTPSGLLMDDIMCHQGIGFEQMFECFHYEALSREETYNRRFIPSSRLVSDGGGCITELISYSHTPFFKMDELIIDGEMNLSGSDSFSVIYILSGSGLIKTADTVLELKAGDQYFLPAKMESMMFCRDLMQGNELRILHCFGPKVTG